MKSREEVKTVYWYIDTIKAMQEMRKSTPNNFEFAKKIRNYLESIENGTSYKEPNTSL